MTTQQPSDLTIQSQLTNENTNLTDPNRISWQGFKIPSQDAAGRSERVNFRCQPAHARMVGDIVAGRLWPYRNSGDLYRHALDRHLKFLASIAPIPSVLRQVDAMMDILREEEFQAEFTTFFEKFQQRVGKLQGQGREQDARALANRLRTYMLDMPEGSWKRYYLDEFEDRFGHFITKSPGIRLTDIGGPGQEVGYEG